MKTNLFTLVFLAFFTITNAQEIPNLSYTQTFDYPEGAQDGSPGSILSPEGMYWNSYSNAYLITYVPVVSTNAIYIQTAEAIVFSFYLPPYTKGVNFSFNGATVATQFCRVANLGETSSKVIPTTYNSGDISDDDWMWLGVGGRTHQYTRDASFSTTGSYVYFAFYNGANVDNDYNGVPEGDLQSVYDLSSFSATWLITEEDSTDYVNWANGITRVNEISENNSNFEIYPNPANTYVQVQTNKTQVENIQVLDITGKIVMQVENNNTQIERLDISNLQNGVYLIKIGTQVQRFIKE